MTKQKRAAAVLRAARRDLGEDFSGWSAVDLILDNLPDVADPDEARSILDALGDPSPDDDDIDVDTSTHGFECFCHSCRQ